MFTRNKMILTVILIMTGLVIWCKASLDKPQGTSATAEDKSEMRLSEGPSSQFSDSHPVADDVWLKRMDRSREEVWPALQKQLDLKPGMVVGDIGCGTGAMTFYFAREVGPEGKVYAIDILAEALEILRQKLPDRNINPYDNVVVVQNCANNTRLPDGTLDLAILYYVHFPAYDNLFPENVEMIQSIYLSLKPGGLVFISDGIVENWASNALRHFSACGFKPHKEHDPHRLMRSNGIFLIKPTT